MLTTGKLGAFESKTFGADNKSVVNGTFNIYGGTNKDNTPRPDIPIKFSAYGEQADFISKFKEGDIIRMVAEPKLNSYPSKDDPTKNSQYVSFTVRAVLDKEAASEVYKIINEKCREANAKNLGKQPESPALNAPEKTPEPAPKARAPKQSAPAMA